MKAKLLWSLGIASFFLAACLTLHGGMLYANNNIPPPDCSRDTADQAYGRPFECSYFENTGIYGSTDGNSPSGPAIHTVSWPFAVTRTVPYGGLTPDSDAAFNGSRIPASFAVSLPQSTKLQTFINAIRTRLFDSSVTNQGRAAAIVDIMLGVKGPAFGGDYAPGIAYAKSNWDAWVALVTAYAANQNGYTANFSAFVSNFNGITTDAGGLVHNEDPGGDAYCDGAGDTAARRAIQCDPDIVAISGSVDTTPAAFVIFSYPATDTHPAGEFSIKDQCANLYGDIAPLEVPPTDTTPPSQPPAVSCGGLAASATAPDPNRPFTLRVSVQYSPAGSASAVFAPAGADTMKMQLSGPSLYATYTAETASPAVSASTGIATATFNVPATNISGVFRVNWQVVGPQAPTIATCSDTITIAHSPYFDILGGDISAGPGFGSGCTPAMADIKGENLDAGVAPANYFGASSRQAAIATGRISQFATDTTNNLSDNSGISTDGVAAHEPSGLAIANSPSVTGAYGGNFLTDLLAQHWCVPDFAAGTSRQTTAPTLPANLGALGPGNYTYRLAGNQTLGGFRLRPGVRVTILVTNGDVFINGNITYAAYASLADIPQFNLIVKNGDITMLSQAPPDLAVTELHGFYADQPDPGTGDNGVIFTCASGLGATSAMKAYDKCNQPLVVYGAVAAKSIVMGRTYGSVEQGRLVSDNPAERFVYTPELWLGDMANCGESPAQTQCLYQSYTALPPVL